MKIKEIYDILNNIAPFETQASWDNSGLNVGNFDAKIDRIFVALELDSKVLDFIESYIDKTPKEDSKSYKYPNFSTLLITHHPVIFKPLKNFNTQIYPCNLIARCIGLNIAVISMHTNFDLAHLNRAFTESLNLETLGYKYSHNKDFSIVFANLDSKKLENIESILNHIKQILNLKHIKYSTNDKTQKIKNIYIICGSGASFISDLQSTDLLITGDIKYHDAMIANSQNISLIEISHFQSEHIFAPLMAKILQKYNIQAIISNSHNPFDYA